MRNLPSVTQHLLLINVFCWIADYVLSQYGIQLSGICGLHYVNAPTFGFWQPLTYMFMHADFTHLFCNMFAVWMFAPVLEREWGSRKFLIYYLICGLGAAAVQEGVWALQVGSSAQAEIIAPMLNTIGASGAVFGILFAFGWLFPDVRMFLLFIPIPIRARTFVLVYAAIELMAGFSHIPGDNVAHFAHLGGMLFGWLLLLWWRKSKNMSIKNLFGSNETETDTRREKDFSDYHYQRRIDD